MCDLIGVYASDYMGDRDCYCICPPLYSSVCLHICFFVFIVFVPQLAIVFVFIDSRGS